MSISASSVTLAAWSSSWWGFPAEAVNRAVYSHAETGPVVPGRFLSGAVCWSYLSMRAKLDQELRPAELRAFTR